MDISDAQILELIARNPTYVHWRRLPDGSVAIICRLLFTYALCLGVTEDAMFTTRRFCYEHEIAALLAMSELTSKYDIPSGWIASRGLPIPG